MQSTHSFWHRTLPCAPKLPTAAGSYIIASRHEELVQARPEDADKKYEEKKRWDDTVKSKQEDLARIGLDEKKVLLSTLGSGYPCSTAAKYITHLHDTLPRKLAQAAAWLLHTQPFRRYLRARLQTSGTSSDLSCHRRAT